MGIENDLGVGLENKTDKKGLVKKDNYARSMNSAIYSLAMREHSRQELYTKLKGKKLSEGVNIDALLDELEENNYLNDERFTESFIRSRAGRGQGPLKIAQELRQRGITSTMIESLMQTATIDWYELAFAQREKKFGANQPVDFNEKARQMRFLSGRGFDADVIRAVVV